MKYIWHYESPIGVLGIVENAGALSHILFETKNPLPGCEKSETPLIKKTISQLREYFAGKRIVFDLPLHLRGTDFQNSVWQALQTISFGETCSYKDLAIKVGNVKACRAVGMANNRNPIPIVVPCHRVVGANGSLTGYAGGLNVKQYLLDLEKHNG